MSTAKNLIEGSYGDGGRDSTTWIRCREGKVYYKKLRDGRYQIGSSIENTQTVLPGDFHGLLREMTQRLGGKVR